MTYIERFGVGEPILDGDFPRTFGFALKGALTELGVADSNTIEIFTDPNFSFGSPQELAPLGPWGEASKSEQATQWHITNILQGVEHPEGLEPDVLAKGVNVDIDRVHLDIKRRLPGGSALVAAQIKFKDEGNVHGILRNRFRETASPLRDTS